MGRKQTRYYNDAELSNYNADRVMVHLTPQRDQDMDRDHVLVIAHDEIPKLIAALQGAHSYQSPYEQKSPPF